MTNKSNGNPANKQPVVQADQTTLDYIDRPANDAWAKAEAVASDSRYSLEHKNEQIAELLSGALVEIEERTKEQTETLVQKQADLRNKSRLSIAPTPEQAAQLEYTHAALNSRWRGMSHADMFADWRVAVDSGDVVTARVYRDFVLNQVQPRGKNADTTAVQVVSPLYKELAARTDDLLSTPDQKQARAELAKVEATLKDLSLVAARARVRVTGVRADRDGKLTNLKQQQISRQFRSRF